jgi:hypothetical protein
MHSKQQQATMHSKQQQEQHAQQHASHNSTRVTKNNSTLWEQH